MNEIAIKLLDWHKSIDRNLPWKQSNNPYFIWLSEIILQQTRVAQGTPYYLTFIRLFPTVHDLATATEEVVFKAWEGLGYYSRARNLHHSAKYISEELNGIFPSSYHEIIKLKGVGPYTAAAISSFAFGEHQAVLDGNVFRVLSRLYNIDNDILSSTGKKIFSAIAHDLLPYNKAADYNQAIMDFGALVCTPKAPKCKTCPLVEDCDSLKKQVIHLRPVKLKKTKKKKRYFHYLIFKNENQIIIKKRNQKDIWEGLFEFPLIEKTDDKEIPNKKEWEVLLGLKLDIIKERERSKQLLSHQEINAIIYTTELACTDKLNEPNLPYLKNKFISLRPKELQFYAFPRILAKLIDKELW